MTIIQDAEKYLNEKPSPFMTKDRRLKRSAVLIEKLVKEIEHRDNLIKVTVTDLRMRADEDGVINISNFIWKELEALSQLEDK